MPQKSSGRTAGLSYSRHFTSLDQDSADAFTWTRRHVKIEEDGKTMYEADVEAPSTWSDLAVTVSAKTWFRRIDGRKEDSIRGMIGRVVDAIAEGSKHPDLGSDYFGGDETRRNAFRAELFHICVGQYAMFNTPVWVNVGATTAKHRVAQLNKRSAGTWGVYSKQPPNVGPQASACFILGVDDTMESLTDTQTRETMLFRHGSGTGSNLSTLRPADSPLSGGGTASGPVSFMRGFDGWAGVTKSGGKSRRAAKMCVLDIYHPDALQFIQTKVKAQKLIRDLAKQGWSQDYNGDATKFAPYQNANNSVRVDDAFMTAATKGDEIIPHWPTQWDGRVAFAEDVRVPVDASRLLDDIAIAAHDCGDPGLQFDTAVNVWHTCKMTGRITSSNPCSEYMFLHDTSCNLASLRLTKFLRADGSFDIAAFSHVARTMFIAQEILVGMASYPTTHIAKNSHDYRPLGLGYCDLGALLMQLGQPYDSDAGRAVCTAVTSLLGGQAYRTSAEIARDCGGAFPHFVLNREEMLTVIDMHCKAASKAVVDNAGSFFDVAVAGKELWSAARIDGERYGFRNGQATVIAPTGTIGFALDCDTTGIEPDTALVKRKKLAGGGVLEYVNQSVEPALTRLGYATGTVKAICAYLKEKSSLPTIGNPTAQAWIETKDLPVFATAFGQLGNEISVDGHLKMMAAAQPFLSGAISKTVNCPAHYTAADIREVFVKAWQLGLKAVAVYRDNSKDQPLQAKTRETAVAPSVGTLTSTPLAARRRLPTDCASHRHKFTLGGIDGYVHLGFYSDGSVGELFVRMEPRAKSQVAVDLATQAASVAIQHGADVSGLLDKWEGTEFLPSGFTGEGELGVPWASSPLDYLARWLRGFLVARAEKTQRAASSCTIEAAPVQLSHVALSAQPGAAQSTSTRCPRCGSAMRRDGACLSCAACGYGQGGCGN